MRAKLTRRLLDAHKPQGETLEVWDADTPGFYARHYDRAGSRWRYALKYRLKGSPRARHHVIGEDGTTIPGDLAERLGLEPRAAWSPEAARREALRVRGLALDGKDPAAGRRVPSIRDFAKQCLAEHAEPFKKPRSVEEDRGLLDRHILKDLGDYRLDRLDQGTVTCFVQARKDKLTTANRCLALVSHLYTKAGEWGVIPAGTNPARGVPRFREAKRQRFPTGEQLARMGGAIRDLERERKVSPFALAAIRWRAFTGARPSEALALRWTDVDLDHGTATLPDSKTGAKVIHMAPPVVKVLAGHFTARRRRARHAGLLPAGPAPIPCPDHPEAAGALLEEAGCTGCARVEPEARLRQRHADCRRRAQTILGVPHVSSRESTLSPVASQFFNRVSQMGRLWEELPSQPWTSLQGRFRLPVSNVQ